MAQDFSRNYRPPGVYIDETPTTIVSVNPVGSTLVAIVGPATGHQTFTEQVVLSATPTRLSRRGVSTASITAVVAATNAVTNVGDFVTTNTTPGSGGSQDYWTDFVAASSPTTPLGTVLFVTYDYTDPTYYTPRRFENFEDVKDVYGEPLNLDVSTVGQTDYQYVESPLALAASIAFANGASELVLCATTPPPSNATTDSAKSTARKAALVAAYNVISNDPSVNVIVPVTAGIATSDAPGVLTDLKTHLSVTTQASLFRFAIVGFDPAVTTAPDVMLTTAGANDKRLMSAYATPSGLLMYSGSGNSTFAVGHQYLAAAYGGRMAALPVQRSITRQIISGFSGLAGTPLSNSLKNQYSASGIAVAEINRLGSLVLRHGVTTDMTSVVTRESGVVRARDSIVTSLAVGMDSSGLIGSALTEDTLLSVKSAISGILETATASETMISYTGLQVRQSVGDPSVVEIKFSYRPTLPLNYIAISFSLDLTTGDTNLDTAA